MTFNPARLGESDEDLTRPIDDVCRKLKRPVRFEDPDGYACDVVAAAMDGNRIAWVEERSKELESRMTDIEFRLHAEVDGRRIINWELATYNPYFGCDVGYMKWWGDRVILVYREKHKTLVARVHAERGAELVAIDEMWMPCEDRIIWESPANDLFEVTLLPELSRGLPIVRGAGTVGREPLVSDRDAFLDDVRLNLFGTDPPEEADLILGSLLHRFWDRGPSPATEYQQTERFPVSPYWFSFYWADHLENAQPFVDRLERIDSRKPESEAARYVVLQAPILAEACRTRRLPEHEFCFFWAKHAQERFQATLDLYPAGFRKAYEALQPHAERWR